MVAALMIGAVTMSFKMAEKNVEATYWFSVNEDESIGDLLETPCPGGQKVCAIGFDQETPPADNLTEAMEDASYVGLQHKR